MPLRPYQELMVEKIMQEFLVKKTVMCQMPTGTGKTEVFCEIIRQFLVENPRKRILVLVHRVELLNQIKIRLRNTFKIDAGTIDAKGLTNYQNNVIIGMVASVVNRNLDFSNWFLIIDEAHHSNANTYISIIDRILLSENSKLLGVTATPARLDGRKLSDIYESLIISPTLKWYIEHKYLSKIRYLGIKHLDLERIPIDNLTRDYNLNSASAIMSSDTILAETLKSYLNFAIGKKTLIFCVDINHAHNVKRRFKEINVDCDIIDSKTNENERRRKIERFRTTKDSILINVLIFTEGFDCPDIEVVILARPTQSITLYLQMIGRVTRLSEGKDCGIILDNAANYKIHGLPTSNYDWQEMFSNPHNLSNQEYVKNNRNKKKVKGKNPPLESDEIELYELIDDESFDCFETNSQKDEYVYISTNNQVFGNLDYRFLPINQDIYYLKNYTCSNCKNLVHRFKNSSNHVQDFDQTLPFFQLHSCNKQYDNVVRDNLILGALPISIKRDRNHSIYTTTSNYQYIISKIEEDIPNFKKIIYEEIDENTLNGLNPIIAKRISDSKICISIFKMDTGEILEIIINNLLQNDLDSLFIKNEINSKIPTVDDEYTKNEKEKITVEPIEEIPEIPINAVKIAYHFWMTKNLDTTRFRNGDYIIEASTNEEWLNAWQNKIPAWCYYDNDCENGKKFGLLYNWYAINDKRQLAPEGWEIPTTTDWKRLFENLGDDKLACNKLIKPEEWSIREFNEESLNISGFSALPGGYRSNSGEFMQLGSLTKWWCNDGSIDNKQSVKFHSIFLKDNLNFKNKIQQGFKGNGYSVRCFRFI